MPNKLAMLIGSNSMLIGFRARAATKKQRSKISLFKLKNESGETQTTMAKIKDKCVDYFSTLFIQYQKSQVSCLGFPVVT